MKLICQVIHWLCATNRCYTVGFWSIMEYCSFPKDEEAWIWNDLWHMSRVWILNWCYKNSPPQIWGSNKFPSFPSQTKRHHVLFFVGDFMQIHLHAQEVADWLHHWGYLNEQRKAWNRWKMMEVWMWNTKVMESHGRWDLGIVTICCDVFFCILKVWVMPSVDKKFWYFPCLFWCWCIFKVGLDAWHCGLASFWRRVNQRVNLSTFDRSWDWIRENRLVLGVANQCWSLPLHSPYLSLSKF